ncbi:unnamed protein product [Rotaria socialis]|nr:unnamed protein product [Rotaria socialis]
MPLTLHFYLLGYISPASPIYCTWWTAFEYTSFVSSAFLLAAISVQRHMLIFNGPFLKKPWMRTLLHDLPLILCLIYPVLFYLFAIILYPCDGTQWDYTNNGCGFADCYFAFDKVLGTFDMLVNSATPVIIDITANVILIVRVARQKRRLQQSVAWRQQRRMILQLFCLSGLFFVAWMPGVIIMLVQMLYDPMFLLEIQMDYLFDLIDVEYVFLPWVSLAFFPELNKWMKKVFSCRPAINQVGTSRQQQLDSKPVRVVNHSAMN